VSKIGDALDILEHFSLPRAQRNDRSALVLLALADMRPKALWRDAKQPSRRIWDIMGFIRDVYKYVTAFFTRSDFRKHAADIAWETEVWIAEDPTHMIHYNGPKFLGPYKRRRP